MHIVYIFMKESAVLLVIHIGYRKCYVTVNYHVYMVGFIFTNSAFKYINIK